MERQHRCAVPFLCLRRQDSRKITAASACYSCQSGMKPVFDASCTRVMKLPQVQPYLSIIG